MVGGGYAYFRHVPADDTPLYICPTCLIQMKRQRARRRAPRHRWRYVTTPPLYAAPRGATPPYARLRAGAGRICARGCRACTRMAAMKGEVPRASRGEERGSATERCRVPYHPPATRAPSARRAGADKACGVTRRRLPLCVTPPEERLASAERQMPRCCCCRYAHAPK